PDLVEVKPGVLGEARHQLARERAADAVRDRGQREEPGMRWLALVHLAAYSHITASRISGAPRAIRPSAYRPRPGRRTPARSLRGPLRAGTRTARTAARGRRAG